MTEREVEIVRFPAKGKTNNEAASKLDLSRTDRGSTSKSHNTNGDPSDVKQRCRSITNKNARTSKQTSPPVDRFCMLLEEASCIATFTNIGVLQPFHAARLKEIVRESQSVRTEYIALDSRASDKLLYLI